MQLLPPKSAAPDPRACGSAASAPVYMAKASWNERIAEASAGHDIRNLLAVVTCAARLVRDEPGAETRAQLCEAIGDAATSLRQITERLTFSAAKSGPELVDVAAFIAHRLGQYGSVLAPGQTLVGQLGCTRRQLWLDASALDRALLNLVMNSRDAMVAGGTLTIRVSCRGSWLWLTMADNGAGMPADVRARVGRPLVTTKATGTGLGIPQALRFAQTSGGRMYLRSESGKGTVISMVFPLNGEEREQ